MSLFFPPVIHHSDCNTPLQYMHITLYSSHTVMQFQANLVFVNMVNVLANISDHTASGHAVRLFFICVMFRALW